MEQTWIHHTIWRCMSFKLCKELNFVNALMWKRIQSLKIVNEWSTVFIVIWQNVELWELNNCSSIVLIFSQRSKNIDSGYHGLYIKKKLEFFLLRCKGFLFLKKKKKKKKDVKAFFFTIYDHKYLKVACTNY